MGAPTRYRIGRTVVGVIIGLVWAGVLLVIALALVDRLIGPAVLALLAGGVNHGLMQGVLALFDLADESRQQTGHLEDQARLLRLLVREGRTEQDRANSLAPTPPGARVVARVPAAQSSDAPAGLDADGWVRPPPSLRP